MKNTLDISLSEGRTSGFIPDYFSTKPRVSIFSIQVILYIYECMDKNRKEEKYRHDLWAAGGLLVNLSDVIPQGG